MLLDQAVQAVVDRLRASGVRATQDGRDANPPCVLVRPPTLHYRFGKGWTGDMEAWAMVPATGQRVDLSALGGLLDDVQDALAGAVVTATPDEAATADGGTVPIYRLTWTQKIPA
jgi:hypothetical protein